MPPLIKRFLDHLGLGAGFARDSHCPSFRTASAWGGPELISNEFFLDVHNIGWRLDRARFDRMLAAEAENRGAIPLAAKVGSIRFDGDRWTIDCGEAGTRTARCVVDATGRAALLSRLGGLKPINCDRLVAATVFFEESESPGLPGADAALIESFRDGWWYTAATPGGRRVAVLMTDADLARRLGAPRLDAWMECLGKTRHVRTIIGAGRPLAPPRLWPAGSRYLEGNVHPGLIAVGDAVSSFDPLSSQGIIKALRSSIFASYAIADWLLRSDDRGFARYRALMKREFASYRETLRDYYRQEQRWPDSPFWHRRHNGSDFRNQSAALKDLRETVRSHVRPPS
ncbi:tryptophan 7-halogenase [Methylocaldum sp.]|uniref:tryptophan 7-halogenase n=1 Tax=Methylocaldum sp. TaxID=1969727 RepID=UPI002D4884A7|nr:tryptophan 7-halogenase [Methylocaldum sp.]HYE36265.1 tryptophan 7-halogenase [Methylocaldum sp.]